MPVSSLQKVFAKTGLRLTQDELDLVCDLYSSTDRVGEEKRGVDYDAFIQGITQSLLAEIEEILTSCVDVAEVDLASYFEAFDGHDLGFLPVEDFKSAIQTMGLEFQQRHIRFLVEYFQEEQGLVNYSNMIEQLSLDKEITLQEDSCEDVDLLQQLSRGLEGYVREGKAEQLWSKFESVDKALTGSVAFSKALKLFKQLSCDISPLNVMRLQKRYGTTDRAGTELLQYRNLLHDLLPSLQKKLQASGKGRTGVELIEKLDEEELQLGLQKIVVALPPELDLWGLFEQFDAAFTSVIARKDFIQCLSWLNVEDPRYTTHGNLDLSTTVYHNRMANTYTQDDDFQVVAYRRFLSDLDELRVPGKEVDCEASHRHEQEVFAQLSGKIKELAMSGIDTEEFLSCGKADQSDTVDFRSLSKQIESCGVRLHLEHLRAFFRPFEIKPDSIDYRQLSCFLLSTSKTEFEEKISKTVNRFEAYKILRGLILERISGGEEREGGKVSIVKTCFEEIDSNSNGVIEPEEFVSAFALLGYRLPRKEADRMIGISCNHVAPASSPQELLELNAGTRFLWMGFETFLKSLGLLLGDEEVKPHPDYYECSMEKPGITYNDLLTKSVEAQTTRAQFIKTFKNIAATSRPEAKQRDLFRHFEENDEDFKGAVEEDHFVAGLQKAFNLTLRDGECQRFATRLNLTDAPGKYNYRRLLRIAFPKPPIEPLHTDETLLHQLRSAALKEEDLCGISCSGELFQYLVSLKEESGDEVFSREENREAMSRLIRALEREDLTIRVEELHQTLRLEVGVEALNYLSETLGKDGMLADLEEIDKDETGCLSDAEFQTLFPTLTEADSIAVMRYFQIFVPSPCQPRSIDYRRMLRHFARRESESPSLPKLEANGLLPNQEVDITDTFETHLPQDVPLWHAYWKVKPDGKEGFAQWKVRKDTMGEAELLISKLSQRMRSYPDEVKLVGESLAAAEMELAIKGVSVAFWKLWFSWCKMDLVCFESTDEEDVYLRYSGLPRSQSEVENNILFTRHCKSFWKKCGVAVKARLLRHAAEPDDVRVEEEICSIGLKRLRTLVERDVQREAEETTESKRTKKKDAGRAHEAFVRRKEALKVYELDISGDRRKVCRYAADENDLHRRRYQLLCNGQVLKENFRDADGNVDFERFANEQMKLERARQKPSDNVCDEQCLRLWQAYKEAGDLAVRSLKTIKGPQARTEDDASEVWEQVGLSLFSIAENRFIPEFIAWSKGFADSSECKALWKTFQKSTARLSVR